MQQMKKKFKLKFQRRIHVQNSFSVNMRDTSSHQPALANMYFSPRIEILLFWKMPEQKFVYEPQNGYLLS